MRDKTAWRKFRAKKKLDHQLEGHIHARILYADAARRARRNDRIVYACLIAAVTTSILALSILLFR